MDYRAFSIECRALLINNRALRIKDWSLSLECRTLLIKGMAVFVCVHMCVCV